MGNKLGGALVGVSLIRTVVRPRSCGSLPVSLPSFGIGGGRRSAGSTNVSVGESGGVIFLLEGDPPSEVSTLLNLFLFKLMLVMYMLELFSMGEWEFPLGQRGCWLVCWLAFEDLSLGLETFGMLVQW